MLRIPTTTAEQLWPFLHFFTDNRIEVGELLAKHHLPNACIATPDIKLSTRFVYQFIDDICQQQNLPNAGWQIGLQKGGAALGQIFDKFLEGTTLEDGLQRVVDFTQLGASHAHFFWRDTTNAKEFCHVGGVPLDSPGYYQVETYIAAVILSMVRVAAGEHFIPNCLNLRSSRPTWPFSVGINDVNFEQQSTGMPIPNEVLRMPMRRIERKTSEFVSAHSSFDAPLTTAKYPKLVNLIEILCGYPPQYEPSLEIMAQAAGQQARTFQRAIRSRETNYQDLIQNLRAERAKGYLLDTKDSVAEVATKMGYNQPQHFIRAFTRITGESPLKWRKARVKKGA